MALTINSLVAAVNLELQNHTKRGTATAEGDGTTTAFLVAPLGGYVINNDTFAVFDDSVEITNGTMEFDTGLYDFSTSPADHSALAFVFDYRSYHDTVVQSAVEAAIESLFPSFYSEKIDDTITSSDFVDNELSIPDCEAVIGFMTNSGTAWTRNPRRNYELYNDGTSPILRFFGGPPTADTMRVHYIARSAVADLPDRAIHPIVSYACYYLLLQKSLLRARGDVAIVTQGTGTLSPRQMNDAANAFYLRYQMQLSTVKKRPWSAA
jgi:hypothetical protein